ncbi:MAG: PD40 domain-containing protein [Bacteriovorax sp.]|nr:PD40 domain-containing protein [Bacteriovorax sp.]
MKKLFFILLFLLNSFVSFAQDENLTVVAVGEATLEKDKMVIQDPYIQGAVTSGQKAAAIDLVKLLRNDFSFYQKKFFLVESAPNNTSYRPPTNYDYWSGKSVRFLGTVSAEKSGENLKINVAFEDIKSRKQVFSSTTTTSISNLRKNGHEIANNIYKKIVGKESIFKSKIVFISDRNTRGSKTIKEVYMMDFDGKNVAQITSHGGIAISPSMSQDGRHLVYSLILNSNGKRNNNLYMMDLSTKESHVISSKDGINSGAIFLPGGKSIALTLTVSGNAEIYEMDLEGKNLRRMTNHFASDVDPSVTYDGKLMAFLSDRAGKAMIYTLDPSGEEKNVKRISFVGQFNATPRFSPDGKEIVFSSWLDSSFDLFKIGSDGSGLSRLTKDFGSNEDPSYSNDGEFIAFTSQRVISRIKADQNIYIMDRDGAILGAITQGFGNCISPRWYNF